MIYNPNIDWSDQTVEIVLQQFDYKGTVKMAVGGNCKGRSVLEDAMELWHGNIVENNCRLQFIENDDCSEWFSCVLQNDNGDELHVEDEERSLEDLIVSVSITGIVQREVQ